MSELDNLWGSIVMNGYCQKLVAEAGDRSGTNRKENVNRWKPLPSNGREDMTVDTNMCVIVKCKV
jgi:hypothetical protein